MPSPGRPAGAERLARLRPDRFTLFLIATAAIGAGLVLAREAAWGVSLSWDSVQYVATARNLLEHPLEFIQMGGEHQDENVYRFWPPLYPVLLAAGSFGVFDPLDVAGPLNAVAFGLTVLVAGRWLRRNVRSRFLLVWGCLALMLAAPVAGIAAWAMSEAAFILFALLALFRAEAHLREGKRPALAQAAAFTALACLIFILACVESVPACIKKVSRPEYKVSCSCKLLVKSLAKSYLACSKSVLTKFMLLYLYCGTEEK